MRGVSLVWVDAVLSGDYEALVAIVDPLRIAIARADDAEMVGWLTSLLSVTHWALNRLPSPEELAIRPDSLRGRFLATLTSTRSGMEGKRLRIALDTSEPEMSRAGSDLLGRGLVIQRRAGRTAWWEASPRGRALLESKLPPALGTAHTFLASIASADPQSEQAEWMVKTAREGLRRSGGHNFDE